VNRSPRPVPPLGLPTPDEVAREFGAPLMTFVEQPHLAEWWINAEREGAAITSAAILYWYVEQPVRPVARDMLWETVRTSRGIPQGSLAAATAAHLEHVVRNTVIAPEHMQLDEWMTWKPTPAAREVRDTMLWVNGTRQRAVRIEFEDHVGYGTLVGSSTVTIAGDRGRIDRLDLALVDRAVEGVRTRPLPVQAPA
jgi:hypothetical protein